ncbi:MAG TPA: ChbG/HpnK family deacetylase [Bryobacteraceae bacterium]|nr:ChbG/HpnK family deacetylase [Bryobacteraceae bacterium]
MKFLITNADDFGYTRDVNEGIMHAHREGILTATTIMATGAAFDHAVALARANPSLDVGVHLVLVGGDGFPPTVGKLIREIAARRIRIYDELVAQVRKVLAAGIRPSHLDSHKHTHLLPPVLTAVARIASEFGIPWVRRPFDLPLHAGGVPWSRKMVSKSLGFARSQFHRVLSRHGCRTTDYFAGFQLTGHYDASELARLIRALPEGSTEFMCHPGFCTAELQASRTRLKESRRRELDALTSPEVRAAVEESGVKLARYAEIR